MRGLKPVRYRHDDALSRATWQQLEHLVADHYRAQGFAVLHVGTGARASRFDGGVDLELRRDGEFVLVQVKHWNTQQVPHNPVHELIGLRTTRAATDVVLVTSGEFTPRAIEAAGHGRHARLIDGVQTRAMLGDAVLATLHEPPLLASGDVSLSATTAGRVVSQSGNASASRADMSHLDFKPRARPPMGRGRALMWTVSLAMAVLFLVIVRALLAQTAWSAGPSRAGSFQPLEKTPVSTSQESAAESPGLDTSDTTRAAAPQPIGAPGMSDADLREWNRRNAESMRIIEAHTPEM